ncbi:hypothetical protein [Butyrivibrio virus Bo-Finn]|nr:hypothetical protein [Butyrivibrio virus Bo-Finn]
MSVYGFDDGNNKQEVYTKQEVLSILQQAIDQGRTEGIDPSLVPQSSGMKEKNHGQSMAFWVGTSAEFNALHLNNVQKFIGYVDENNNVYIMTDDDTLTEIARQFEADRTRAAEWEDLKDNLYITSGTLTAGETSITLTDERIQDGVAIIPYISKWGVFPTNVVAAAGSVTMTFEAQSNDITVGVGVR